MSEHDKPAAKPAKPNKIAMRQKAVAPASTGELRTSSGPRPEMNMPPSALRKAAASMRPASGWRREIAVSDM